MSASLLYRKKRVENANPPTLMPLQHNERHTEVSAEQKAPDPPRQGDAPARPARRQRYTVLAFDAIRSVMALHQAGVVRKKEFRQEVSSPRGKALSWDERVNIDTGAPEAYGSRFAIYPRTRDEERLQAEMGL